MPDIEVVIRKGTSADGVSQTQASSTSQTQGKPSAKGKKNMQQEAVNAALIQIGQQMVSQGIQQYGNLTGNYAAVEGLNAVTSIGADIATIAVGGVAGAVAVAGKYAIQFATSFADNARRREEHNFTVERLGRISTKGSRY